MALSTCSRLICRNGLPRSSWWAFSLGHIHAMSTATGPTESMILRSKTQNNSSSSSSSSYSSPLMMLPPTINDDTSTMTYKFYSLAESRVITRPQSKVLTDHLMMPKHIHDPKFCGSSHGWLAMLNPHTLDMFLYDPISLRHIKLPPIHDLPNIPKGNELSCVTKVILSCSPDEDERNCRALMIYNCTGPLAFCCPGRNNEWTTIGKTHIWDVKAQGAKRYANGYEDIVYSSRQNLFFVLDQDSHLETWDLSEPSFPRMIKTDEGNLWDLDDFNTIVKDDLLGARKYLMVADELCSHDKDDILVLSRYLIDDDDLPSGSRYLIGEDHLDMTIGFNIVIYDQDEGRFKDLVYDQEKECHKGIDCSREEWGMNIVQNLGDFALFVGCHSDSVALSASRFPELLKPSSIYFPDAFDSLYQCGDTSFCGYDFGIFNFESENKYVTPCYYPNDVQRRKGVVPFTMWFFPRGYA